jgi:hypothetical protein
MGWPRGPSVVCLFVMMVQMHDSASTDVNLKNKTSHVYYSILPLLRPPVMIESFQKKETGMPWKSFYHLFVPVVV